MKKLKSIGDFLPKKQKEKESLVQAFIPTTLKNKVLKQLEADGMTQKDFLIAAFKAYADEKGVDVSETKKKS